MNVCAVIPTFNNAATLQMVVEETRNYVSHVIVVNDGSTDNTETILCAMDDTIELISYKDNRGKGAALQLGLDRARLLGYTHAVTIDSDGQHFPADIPVLLEAASRHPGDIIIGRRGTRHDNMNGGSKFANKFSNFWFAVQTFRTPGDTQSGLRVYPLAKPMRFFTSRYEAELAVMVDACWRGIGVTSVPVRVYYPPAHERVSHFKPAKDFTRISLLNTLLTFLAFVYGYPSMAIHALRKLC